MKLTLLFLIISTIVTLGESIQCYSCMNDSISTEEQTKICGDPFKKEEMKLCTGTYCAKIIGTAENASYSVSIVRRVCTESLSNLAHPKSRISRSIHEEYATIYYCESDFCNSVSQVFNPFSAIRILLVTFISLVLYMN